MAPASPHRTKPAWVVTLVCCRFQQLGQIIREQAGGCPEPSLISLAFNGLALGNWWFISFGFPPHTFDIGITKGYLLVVLIVTIDAGVTHSALRYKGTRF